MKKFLCIILSFAMITGIAMMSVNATSNKTMTEEEKIKNNLIGLHFISYDYVMSRGNPMPYESASINEIWDMVDKAGYVLDSGDATFEDYNMAYNNLMKANYSIEIADYWAQQTYELAMKEKNYNNWYSEDDWSTFDKNRNALKSALDSKSSSEISEAYYDLLECYNIMTNRYTLKGDVNKDGVVNVSDVTLVQKYLVNLVDFTGAQRMLVGDYNYENFNVSAVTYLQRYIVGTRSNIPDNDIFISDIDVAETDERLFERTFNYIICPRVDVNMAYLPNGYYDTKFLENYYRVYHID